MKSDYKMLSLFVRLVKTNRGSKSNFYKVPLLRFPITIKIHHMKERGRSNTFGMFPFFAASNSAASPRNKSITSGKQSLTRSSGV